MRLIRVLKLINLQVFSRNLQKGKYKKFQMKDQINKYKQNKNKSKKIYKQKQTHYLT